MKKFYYITVGLLGLLLLLDLVFVPGTFGRPGTYIALTFCGLLLGFVRYGQQMGKKLRIGGHALAILFSLVVYLLTIFVVLVLAFNYPPAGEFEEKLEVQFGPKSHRENYSEFVKLLERFDQTHGDQLSALSEQLKEQRMTEEVRRFRKTSADSRAKLIEFIIQNPISPSEENVSLESEIPKSINLINIYRLELANVKDLLERGKTKQARDKYLELWQSAGALLQGHNTTITYLVNIAIFDQLIGQYFETGIELTGSERKQLLGLIKATGSRLDEKSREFLGYEYHWLKQALASKRVKLADEKEIVNDLPVPGSLIRSGWPLYDANKIMKRFHDRFSELDELYGRPYYEIEEELRNYEQQIQRETELFDFSRPWTFLQNPVGEILYAASFPMFAGVVRDKAALKSRLRILRFVLQNPNLSPGVKPPVDNLTGKPYKLEFKNGKVEISSRVEDEDIEVSLVVN